MQIRYVDRPRLRRSLLATTEHARGIRAELNRINVFPVPDGDTGTNRVFTAPAIADRLHAVRERSISVVARELAAAFQAGPTPCIGPWSGPLHPGRASGSSTGLPRSGRGPGRLRRRGAERLLHRGALVWGPDLPSQEAVQDRLRASGGVGGKGTAWIGSTLGVKPILAVDREGNVESAGTTFGRKRVLPAMMRRLEEVVPSGVRDVRFGVVHVGCEEVVEGVVRALGERWPDAEVLSGPPTPVIATRVGIGPWAVAYMVEDGVLDGRVE